MGVNFFNTLNTFQSFLTRRDLEFCLITLLEFLPSFIIILGTLIGDFGSMWTAAAATLKPKESLRCALFGSMDDAARRM